MTSSSVVRPSAAAVAADGRVPWRSRLTRADVKLAPYFFIAPFFVLFAIFGAFPLVYTGWVSLHDWHLIGEHTFVGFGNYTALFADPDFWNALRNTVGIFILATVPQLLMALAIANLLNRKIRARTFFRMGVLIPNVTSVAAVGIVFGQLFARDVGLVNYVITRLGLDAVDWQANTWSSWIAIAVMVDWRWTGYNTLILLGAMQAIPKDLFESASLDGAKPWQQFWRITVPLLRPTLVFTVVISTIGGLQLFTEPVIFGNGRMLGGTLGQFQTVTMYMYENAFQRFQYGYGAAIAWALFGLIVIFSLINLLLVRRAAR
ncbi:sugar ABC transporter permease [Kribbella albertanoniae]|uniref:Sugar ABC transporter permease n=1 Tax=Kribbella albertanoniae TaxID=1266829 RepID=A0A4R4QAR5_9ACTN|nr:sugar ABC transporter permease [Kribbella albertanoniae]TDC32491.1 sugar ABC transporter permease [Kribbella albertanoniae]